MIDFQTPIHKLISSTSSNDIYIKRDDLLPFSFGGNKVRIAYEFMLDMMDKKCNCMIAYGNPKSNLCRTLASLSKSENFPCFIVSPNVDGDESSFNRKLTLLDIPEENIFSCEKVNVSATIQMVIDIAVSKGYTPYYINGDIFGRGNEKTPVQAYVNCYNEIISYEKGNKICFDYIFHASGTGMTQSGLICGAMKNSDNKKIVGISIARTTQNGLPYIHRYVSAYSGITDKNIIFCDKYICGGYGKYNSEILDTIKKAYQTHAMPLDATYTGKAYWGMNEYIKENGIQNKKILFIHTGGLPLFFDILEKLNKQPAIIPVNMEEL